MALTPLKELPDYTIGWAVLDWCSKWLVNPDDLGGEKGATWIFKPDQIRFILHFYAVNKRGEWVVTQAYRERAKGTGKSPMVAAIACAELCGPTVFSHFVCEHGNHPTLHCTASKAVGRRRKQALIWLAATSEAGTNHTYAYAMNMWSDSAKAEFNLDVGQTRIQVRGRKDTLITQVTASPRSLEGPIPTFVICEETQNWLPSEKGPQLMSTIARGLQKSHGRRVEVTNAPEPGKGSVAEATHKKWAAIQEGLEQDPGMLFDTFMIHVDDVFNEEEAIPALREMYKDAPWMPPHLTYRGFFDQAYTEVDIRRFFFNEIVPPNAMWIDEKTWEKARRDNLKLKKRDLISLGFRVRKHSCAVVACRLSDQAVFLLKKWERPGDAKRDWEVPYADIDEYVRGLLDVYNVYNLIASPNGMQDIIGRWSYDYADSVEIEEVWLNKNPQKAADIVEMFESGVSDERIVHDGDLELRRHVMQCFVHEVPQGRLIRPEMESSRHYITAAEAAILSVKAANEAILDGALDEGPGGTLYFY